MSKVLITRSKLDDLATTIAAKSGATLPLTIAQMDAAVESIAPAPTLQSKTATPTESAQTITPDSGYDGLSSVSVGAISSTYVGSGIDQRSSTDLTASGATVTVPAGYYAEQASKAVASGSAGTPTATKGTVSNHAVSVTPSVTNTTGYITGGTKTGTAVTVSASELVSGSETKTENGTYDVTNLASLIVDVDGYTLTTVCPQQTITPNSDRIAYPVGSFDYEVGEFYLVTFDGVEYVTSCALCWETNHVIGDTRVIWGDVVTVAPFCAITTSVTDKEVYCRDTNTHTIKVEHLELGTPAATLTTKSITSNGTYSASSDNADGYSSITVNVSGGGSPTLQSKTATPTTSQQVIQPDNGYDGLSQVTVNAIPSQYIVPSGNKAITANGTGIDVAEYATVSVNVSGSSKNVQVAQSTTRATSSTYTKLVSLTCSVTGTYDVYWDCFRSTTGGTSGSKLYVGGSTYGTANTTFSNHAQTNHLTGVQINANQEVAVYARSRGNNYYAYCGQLTIVQTA